MVSQYKKAWMSFLSCVLLCTRIQAQILSPGVDRILHLQHTAIDLEAYIRAPLEQKQAQVALLNWGQSDVFAYCESTQTLLYWDKVEKLTASALPTLKNFIEKRKWVYVTDMPAGEASCAWAQQAVIFGVYAEGFDPAACARQTVLPGKLIGSHREGFFLIERPVTLSPHRSFLPMPPAPPYAPLAFSQSSAHLSDDPHQYDPETQETSLLIAYPQAPRFYLSLRDTDPISFCLASVMLFSFCSLGAVLVMAFACKGAHWDWACELIDNATGNATLSESEGYDAGEG